MTGKIAELLSLWRSEPQAPHFEEHVRMSEHTTFRAGGPADVFALPANARELGWGIRTCKEREIPYYVMGRGSNILVSDDGFHGVIFHIGESFSDIRVSGDVITAGAGVTLTALARTAKNHGLTGLEFAAGIPGSLGGALAMNAGAYGGEMKDVVTGVQVLDPLSETGVRFMPLDELAMGYRTSRIQTEGLIAMGAEMKLKAGDPAQIEALMQDLAERRRSKQPLEYPSAGSTFKRPEGYFAGKLIQDAGLSGYSVGGACVSEKHCGFVINKDHASATDIYLLMMQVQKKVKEVFGVELEPEVRLLGDFPENM